MNYHFISFVCGFFFPARAVGAGNRRHEQRRLSRTCVFSVLSLWSLVSVLAGCAERVEPSSIAEPILNVDAATPLTGVALVRSTFGGERCSGVLIAPTLLVTAMHCVFQQVDGRDTLLDVDSLRVGFGPNSDTLFEVGAIRVDWPGMPQMPSVADAQAAGEDVVVLKLSQTAPQSEQIWDFSLDFSPEDQQAVRVIGYGLTDVALGSSGIRGLGDGRVTAYDRSTGVLQVSGAGACFGDSGGPVLLADSGEVVAILGSVQESQNPCSANVAYAYSAGNSEVRRFLSHECYAVGNCGGTSSGAEGGLDGSSGTAAQDLDGSSGAAGQGFDTSSGGTGEGGSTGNQSHHRTPGGCHVSFGDTPVDWFTGGFFLMLGISLHRLRRSWRS